MKKAFFIFVSLLVIVLIAVSTINWYKETHKVMPIPVVTDSEKEALAAECKELKDSGVTDGESHFFEGSIKENMKIKMELLCNHQTLLISGAVTQKIDSSLWDKANSEEEHQELADFGAGDQGLINTETDYNFDGYKDLEMLQVDGQGSMAIDTYIVLLYDPTQKKFVYSRDLSKLTNLGVNDKKQVITFHGEGSGSFSMDVYEWVGEKLVLKENESCNGDALAYKGDSEGRYTYKKIVYDAAGKETVMKIETKKMGEGSCADMNY